MNFKTRLTFRREAEKKAAKNNEEDQEDQNVDQEYLDLGVDTDLFADQIDKEGEKYETFSSRNNNNNKQKTPTQDQTSKKKKKETEPEPETDRRKTYFSFQPRAQRELLSPPRKITHANLTFTVFQVNSWNAPCRRGPRQRTVPALYETGKR